MAASIGIHREQRSKKMADGKIPGNLLDGSGAQGWLERITDLLSVLHSFTFCEVRCLSADHGQFFAPRILPSEQEPTLIVGKCGVVVK